MKQNSGVVTPSRRGAQEQKSREAGYSYWRMRIVYTVAFVVTIILGLGSRSFSSNLPAFVVDHFGDMLWASMVYFGVRGLLPAKSLQFTFIASLGFCFIIEFSQLYQAEWINAIRKTLPGSLILGRGFLAVDLVRYSVGIILAYVVDLFLLKRAISK